ncbi:hypothetical protein [Brevibacillus reuszeri]|uniref:hypothetical protein n=1 Tax=Brevibacillus reuszeri TaxID=54915 RepID=UPI0013DEBC81|nr:hypothetical protein [Brevibacillus reuszeri]
MKKALASVFAVALLLTGAVSASADIGERGKVAPPPPEKPPIVTYDIGERG